MFQSAVENRHLSFFVVVVEERKILFFFLPATSIIVTSSFRSASEGDAVVWNSSA